MLYAASSAATRPGDAAWRVPSTGQRTAPCWTLPRGGIFNDRAYLKIFHKARAVTFTPSESASLLAKRPTTCGTRRSLPG